MEEQSLLDYLKERLSPRRAMRGNGNSEQVTQVPADRGTEPSSTERLGENFPWRSILAVMMA
jgi:hypothetical protein